MLFDTFESIFFFEIYSSKENPQHSNFSKCQFHRRKMCHFTIFNAKKSNLRLISFTMSGDGIFPQYFQQCIRKKRSLIEGMAMSRWQQHGSMSAEGGKEMFCNKLSHYMQEASMV